MPETILDSRVAPLEFPPVTPPASPAVEKALAEIQSDSQARPEEYLDDTVVPHGGE